MFEQMHNSTEQQNETNNRREYHEIMEQKREFQKLVSYLENDPVKVLDEEFPTKRNIVEGWKASREGANGIGYEKIPGFTRMGKNGEVQKVEYRGGVIETTVALGNEVLKINISNFAENTDKGSGTRKEEKPITVSYSGYMSKETLSKIFGDENINNSKLLNYVADAINGRKGDYHGIYSHNEKALQQQKDAEAEHYLFLALLPLEEYNKGVTDKTQALKNYIHNELPNNNISSLKEAKLCAALVILGRSMSIQQIRNKFNIQNITKNKTGGEVGGSSTMSQSDDILEYMWKNTPSDLVQHSQEIIDEATKNITYMDYDEFAQLLQS